MGRILLLGSEMRNGRNFCDREIEFRRDWETSFSILMFWMTWGWHSDLLLSDRKFHGLVRIEGFVNETDDPSRPLLIRYDEDWMEPTWLETDQSNMSKIAPQPLRKISQPRFRRWWPWLVSLVIVSKERPHSLTIFIEAKMRKIEETRISMCLFSTKTRPRREWENK